jgi:hypothetical protein
MKGPKRQVYKGQLVTESSLIDKKAGRNHDGAPLLRPDALAQRLADPQRLIF